MDESSPVSLTAKWFMKPGCEEAALAAPGQLAKAVQAEDGTLIYLLHRPFTSGDHPPQSLPPSEPNTVVFFEMYRNVKAFHDHVKGAVFAEFVKHHGELFVAANGKPFVLVEFLSRQTGFIR